MKLFRRIAALGLALLLLLGLIFPENFIMFAAWAEDSEHAAETAAATEAESELSESEPVAVEPEESEEVFSTEVPEAWPAESGIGEDPETAAAEDDVPEQTVTVNGEGFEMEIRGKLPTDGQIVTEPAETPAGITAKDSVSYRISAADKNRPQTIPSLEITVHDPKIRELSRNDLQILVVCAREDGSLEPMRPLSVTDDTVTFRAEGVSVFTVGGYATDTLLTWSTEGYVFSLLGIESVNALCAEAPAASEPGMDVLGAWSLSVSGPLSLVSDYHVIVRARTEPQLQDRESVNFCQVRAGAVKNALAQEIGGQACIHLEDADGVFALVQDSGLREQSLESDAVRLMGLMPKNAALSVTDVRDDSQATAEGTVLAAYDISILDQGEEFQPASGHPIEVSIALDDTAVSAENLQLWHVRDDGSRERITDFALLDGRICFSASGFSVYEIVVAPDPYTPPETAETVADMTEFGANYDNANGFLLSVYRRTEGKAYFFKNTISGNGAFTPDLNILNASRWFFKPNV